MKKRTIGMWIYQNGGGKEIEEKIKKQLQEREIESLTGVNLNNAIVSNGSVLCDSHGNCYCDLKNNIDLFFSYNAGEQTPYQTYLYQTLDKLMPTINNYESFKLTEDKFQTSFLLKHNGIATADYEFFHKDNHLHLDNIMNKWSSAVCKPLNGWGGQGLTKIEQDSDISLLKLSLEQLNLSQVYVEKFINYDNTDYRVDIVDGNYIACYGRKAKDGDWKTNITSGGSIFLREPEDEVVQLALRAAKITGLEIAGVDILYDREKEEYIVLEVNGIPAFATQEQETLGLNFNDKKIKHIVELIDKRSSLKV